MEHEVNTRIRQRSVMEFLFKSGDSSATVIHSKLKPVYGNHTLDRSTIQRWIQRFQTGDFDISDKERPGRPSSVATDRIVALVEEMVKNDRTITTYRLMERLSISKGSVLKLLSDLGYRKLCSKWVPKLLTREMMQTRKEICLDLIESFPGPPTEAFKGVITCDETWVYHYDPSSKRQSMQWTHTTSPIKKKPRLSLSKDKIMISIFWDQDGLIFMDILEKNSSINKERYCKSLEKLKRAISTKRPGLKDTQIKFHQDNARPHTAQQTLARIARYGWTLMPHPAYSPDLAPSDFYLFGKLKNFLRGRTFENDEKLLQEVRGWFRMHDVAFYQSAFVSWKERWTKCVQSEGGYIE